MGGCRDMPAAYMMADVVVSASERPEAFGRVLAEGEAMRRLVVGANHGAARETVIDGETGWLFAPGDAAALASAIGEALAMPDDARKAVAQRAMAPIHQNFSLQQMCEATLAVLREVLAGDKAGSRT